VAAEELVRGESVLEIFGDLGHALADVHLGQRVVAENSSLVATALNDLH